MFQTAGVDVLIELPFTEELKHMPAAEFLRDLKSKVNFSRIVCGTDFHFGYRRSGSYQTLLDYQKELGYEAIIVKKLQYDGEDISSSRIRECICRGDMALAAKLLGYPYFVCGTVVKGEQLGHTIGIPTANLLPDENKLLPPFGVYITRVIQGSDIRFGITNVGRKPTVGNHPVGVETYLYDYDGNLYGKEILVEFLAFLRPEKRFDSLESLKREMEENIAFGRKYIRRELAGMQE